MNKSGNPTLGRPYCNACGYDLTNLTQSNKCPECGRLLVDILVRQTSTGTRYKSSATIAGYPLVSIAFGPHEDEKHGKPVGIIAIGEYPKGVIAIGIFPRGFIALGSFAVGFVAMGGGAAGVVAFGGTAVGVLAFGGMSLGVYAVGGMVLFFIYGQGGLRIPLWP